MNLVRKELKVKYTASVLGTIWSLLNPVVFLAVFTFVSIVLTEGMDDFPVFLLSGLLAWNLFSVSLTSGAQSVLANANLVKKVAFPREVLPLATIGVALVDFVLQSLVFLAFMVVFGYGFTLDVVWLYPLAFIALLTFTTAVTLWVSAMNVRYRDVQHLLSLALLVWFWLTPIVYPVGPVSRAHVFTGDLGHVYWAIYLANPVTWIVAGFQRALYHSGDAATMLAGFSDVALALGITVALAVSTLLLWLTWRLFFSLSGDFAEEL